MTPVSGDGNFYREKLGPFSSVINFCREDLGPFLKDVGVNICKGYGNVLFNGFASDISKEKKSQQTAVKIAHFNPISKWSDLTLEWHEVNSSCKSGRYVVTDKTTQDKYGNDSRTAVRMKCAALFFATLVVQPIGLTLNLLNKITKIVFLMQLWHPSKEEYNFKARLGELGKDLLVVVSTPLILVGMVFSAFYGAILSPYDGRKLYGSFERLAYSGGYQSFALNEGKKEVQDYLLAPCFQPEPKAHLGGGELGKPNVW